MPRSASECLRVPIGASDIRIAVSIAVSNSHVR